MEAYKPTDDFPYYIKELYLPLEELGSEWIWTVGEIHQFDDLWKAGMPIKDMAEYFNKHESTILVVWLDRYIQGKLEPREGWNIW